MRRHRNNQRSTYSGGRVLGRGHRHNQRIAIANRGQVLGRGHQIHRRGRAETYNSGLPTEISVPVAAMQDAAMEDSRAPAPAVGVVPAAIAVAVPDLM